MLIGRTPDTLRAPFANYSHGIEIEAGARLLLCSGQLGIAANDYVPADAGEQATLCFENIGAVLRSANMDYGNIVRINAYVTHRDWLPAYMKVRDRFVHSPAPASTLMIVSGFAREVFKVEVEVIAAAEACEPAERVSR